MKKIFNRSIYTKNDAGNLFFMALLLPSVIGSLVILTILPLFFLSSNFEIGENSSYVIPILSILIAQGGMFLVYFLFNKILRMNTLKASRISFKINTKNILLAVLIGAITLFGLSNLINVFDALFQQAGHTASPLPLPLDNGWWLALNLVLLAVLPAIIEELVFRGAIYNGLKQYGKITAIIVSSLLFALIHGNIDQTVYPILFGLVLAYIVYKTDNIIYSMIAHFINNAIVIVLGFIYTINPSLSQPTTPQQFLTSSYIGFAVLFMVVAMALVFFIGKLFKKSKFQTVSLLDEIPDNLSDEDLAVLTSENATDKINTTPNGVDRKVWEQIICQKNDIKALEKSSSSANVLLWVGVGISILLWLLSI